MRLIIFSPYATDRTYHDRMLIYRKFSAQSERKNIKMDDVKYYLIKSEAGKLFIYSFNIYTKEIVEQDYETTLSELRTIASINKSEKMMLFFEGHGLFNTDTITSDCGNFRYFIHDIVYICASIYRTRHLLSPDLNRIWLFNCDTALGSDESTNRVMKVCNAMARHNINCQVRGVAGALSIADATERIPHGGDIPRYHTDKVVVAMSKHPMTGGRIEVVPFPSDLRVRFIGTVLNGNITYTEKYLEEIPQQTTPPLEMDITPHKPIPYYKWHNYERNYDEFFKLYLDTRLEIFKAISTYRGCTTREETRGISELSSKFNRFLDALVNKQTCTNLISILSEIKFTPMHRNIIPLYNKMIKICFEAITRQSHFLNETSPDCGMSLQNLLIPPPQWTYDDVSQWIDNILFEKEFENYIIVKKKPAEQAMSGAGMDKIVLSVRKQGTFLFNELTIPIVAIKEPDDIKYMIEQKITEISTELSRVVPPSLPSPEPTLSLSSISAPPNMLQQKMEHADQIIEWINQISQSYREKYTFTITRKDENHIVSLTIMEHKWQMKEFLAFSTRQPPSFDNIKTKILETIAKIERVVS